MEVVTRTRRRTSSNPTSPSARNRNADCRSIGTQPLRKANPPVKSEITIPHCTFFWGHTNALITTSNITEHPSVTPNMMTFPPSLALRSGLASAQIEELAGIEQHPAQALQVVLIEQLHRSPLLLRPRRPAQHQPIGTIRLARF